MINDIQQKLKNFTESLEKNLDSTLIKDMQDVIEKTNGANFVFQYMFDLYLKHAMSYIKTLELQKKRLTSEGTQLLFSLPYIFISASFSGKTPNEISSAIALEMNKHVEDIE
jgi:hypothetical protein